MSNATKALTSDTGDRKLVLNTKIVLATDKDQWVVEMIYMKMLMKKRDFRTLVRRPFVLQLRVSICEMVSVNMSYSMMKMKTGNKQLYKPISKTPKGID